MGRRKRQDLLRKLGHGGWGKREGRGKGRGEKKVREWDG